MDRQDGSNTADEPRQFRQANFAQQLRVPEEMEYVNGSTIKQISSAITNGFAVFGEGCDGKVFVWPTENGYEADHFCLGPPTPHHLNSVEDAANFAAAQCE